MPLAFSFYVQHFKTSLFLTFSNYKYTLAHFQEKAISKKINNLMPKAHHTHQI